MAQSTITSANPGNIVVPLSAIIDQLKNTLSSSQIDALLNAIVSKKQTEVRPGDLITAEFINQILSDIVDLNIRVAKLETVDTGNTDTQPAIGFIDASYKGSARGINVVPNDRTPFPHTFTIINSTNKDLRLDLNAQIIGATGDWSQAALFSNNLSSRTITVTQKSQATVDVFVIAPVNAKEGDKPTLIVTTKAGHPHNLLGDDSVGLVVSSQAGNAVVRNLKIVDVLNPRDFLTGVPVGADGAIPQGKTRTLTFNFKYDDSSTTPIDPGFELVATLDQLTPATLNMNSWSVVLQGGAASSDVIAGGVRTVKTNVGLSLGSVVPLSVALTAPQQTSQIRIKVAVRSTKLPNPQLEEPKTYIIASI